ncbi:MAG: hypothetical protein K2X73_03995 [Sphingomonas sp.]|uniref:hypothetical protein n=1 Tax=Sphingomonas sp. TaxID=28214 RepID=UPI0025E59BA5|nr:hypothetical protein [Sphingomonas sp.]MBX9881115.1 hypothetical protein [Sphingomonas sp.]
MLALQAIGMPADVPNFDLGTVAVAEPTRPTLSLCAPGVGAEVVVCGRRGDQYRLPLPVERDLAADGRTADSPGGMAALTPAGRCGLFAGERQCSRREAAAYGYGNGRDPITVLLRLGDRLVAGN